MATYRTGCDSQSRRRSGNVLPSAAGSRRGDVRARAANILTQVPAFAIHNYDQVLRTNALCAVAVCALVRVVSGCAGSRARSARRFGDSRSDARVPRAPQDDDRARRLAADTLDILLGTLLRPLHRKTRLAAFGRWRMRRKLTRRRRLACCVAATLCDFPTRSIPRNGSLG